MRPALLVRRSFSVGGLILLTCVLAVPGAQQSSAYFPLGIDYPSDARTSASEIARDLQTVRSAGFNTIKTTISWREGEPVRGEYRLGALLRTLEVADRYGVRVILQIDRAEPGWVGTRYPDRQRTVEPSTRDCVEHPGVHGDLARFLTTAAKATARFRSLLTIDIGSPVPSAWCGLGALARAARQALPAEVSISSHTSRSSLLPSPAGDPPGRDDWRTSVEVGGYYGILVDASFSPVSAAERALALDTIAGASRGGWWLYSGDVPEPDRRFNAWLAIAHGAKGLIFDDPPPETAFIGTIARNPALFHQVKRRRARVALVFDSLEPLPSSAQLLAPVHRALFERQIAVDIIDAHALTDEIVVGYRALIATSSRSLRLATGEALKTFQSKGGLVIDAAAAAGTVQRVVDQVTSAGIAPDVRIDGGSDIDVRFLESATVQMIVALNHSPKAQRVTMTFPPETQEAIWLNMETGNGVNFIAGPVGPLYQYWFRPRDALVLMIRKDIR
jgi:hypothetical protein